MQELFDWKSKQFSERNIKAIFNNLFKFGYNSNILHLFLKFLYKYF